jgi:hypothetical protein
MPKVKVAPKIFALLAAAILAGPAAAGVEIVAREAERRVEIRIDGAPFTEYRYEPDLKKPILFPLRTDRGLLVTRGFPLEPRPGERVDHPHHAGLWLNYGDVAGVDFWNNSPANARTAEMGTVVHRAVRKAEGGKVGRLDVEMDWVLPGNKTALREETRFVFRTGKRMRVIDRITTLSAAAERVVLAESKEGLLGLRVARFLEQREGKPVALTGADGRAGEAILDEEKVTGRYLTSEGKAGDEAWGTRGRWTLLGGVHQGQDVTLAILDHPGNAGHPTYWHARGYGLFAANPIGQHVFDARQEKRELVIEPGRPVTFRYRVLIVSKALTAKDVEKEYRRFIETKD